MLSACPFCERFVTTGALAANDNAVANPDCFPVTDGRTLIVPRRHVSSLWDLTADELDDIWKLAAEVRQVLFDEHTIW